MEDCNMLRERSPLLVIVFSILTFGLYFLYWFYDTNSQFKNELDDGSHPGLRTLALFVPILGFVAMYKHTKSAEAVTDGRDWLLPFLAYVVFPPISWFVIQSDINDALQ